MKDEYLENILEVDVFFSWRASDVNLTKLLELHFALMVREYLIIKVESLIQLCEIIILYLHEVAFVKIKHINIIFLVFVFICDNKEVLSISNISLANNKLNPLRS